MVRIIVVEHLHRVCISIRTGIAGDMVAINFEERESGYLFLEDQVCRRVLQKYTGLEKGDILGIVRL